jgi:hypothetical protein
MRFAKRVFLFAGVYGLVVLLPQYFFEAQIGRDYPPPITHPEHFYGFVGVAVAWQLAFLTISTDPIRYRPVMIAAIVEKLSFAVAAIFLFTGGRIPAIMFAFAMIDLLLAALFTVAFVRTPSSSARQ